MVYSCSAGGCGASQCACLCRTILVSNEGEPSGYGDPKFVDPEVNGACRAALQVFPTPVP